MSDRISVNWPAYNPCGRRNSASVLRAPSYQMLNGQTLTRATLSAAGIAATDVSASNGIVHVINAVLIP